MYDDDWYFVNSGDDDYNSDDSAEQLLNFDEPVHDECDIPDIGLLLAIAEDISKDTQKTDEYDLDENTDKENFEKAMELNRVGTNSNLRPFEQYVDDICKGKRSLFKK